MSGSRKTWHRSLSLQIGSIWEGKTSVPACFAGDSTLTSYLVLHFFLCTAHFWFDWGYSVCVLNLISAAWSRKCRGSCGTCNFGLASKWRWVVFRTIRLTYICNAHMNTHINIYRLHTNFFYWRCLGLSMVQIWTKPNHIVSKFSPTENISNPVRSVNPMDI